MYGNVLYLFYSKRNLLNNQRILTFSDSMYHTFWDSILTFTTAPLILGAYLKDIEDAETDGYISPYLVSDSVRNSIIISQSYKISKPFIYLL